MFKEIFGYFVKFDKFLKFSILVDDKDSHLRKKNITTKVVNLQIFLTINFER